MLFIDNFNVNNLYFSACTLIFSIWGFFKGTFGKKSPLVFAGGTSPIPTALNKVERVGERLGAPVLFLSAAAAVRFVFVVLAVKTCLVEGRIIHIIILFVAGFVLADAECINVLTKSKRCQKTLEP